MNFRVIGFLISQPLRFKEKNSWNAGIRFANNQGEEKRTSKFKEEPVMLVLTRKPGEKIRISDEIVVTVVHKGVGQISESDVLLATASDAVIVGFNVRPSIQANRLAENECVEIKLYSIIYNAIEEIKSAMEGMMPGGEGGMM